MVNKVNFPGCCTARIITGIPSSIFRDINKPSDKKNLECSHDQLRSVIKNLSARFDSDSHPAMFVAVLTRNQRNRGGGKLLTEGFGFTECFHAPKDVGTEGHQETGDLYMYAMNQTQYRRAPKQAQEWLLKVLGEESIIKKTRRFRGELSFADLLDFRDRCFDRKSSCLMASAHYCITTYDKYASFNTRERFFSRLEDEFGLLPRYDGVETWGSYIQRVNKEAKAGGLI